MRKRLSIAAGLALAIAAAPAAAAAPACPRLDTDLLEAELDDLAAFADYAVTVEVRDGDDRWKDAAGPRDLDEDAPDAKAGDRVRIGSVTKSMTAAVVLQLHGEGEIHLDAPIDDYLPGLLPYEEQPTVRQLLQHTGGVPDFLPHLYPSLMRGDLSDLVEGHRDHYEPEELIAVGAAHPQQFEPGEGWAYSNTGYMVLGLLVEEVTGESLGHELEERIFEPAGLDRTYFPADDTNGFRGPHAVPYVTTGDPDAPYFDASEMSNTQLWAGGGVISTVHDVNDFFDALVDGTLLSDELLAEATAYTDTGRSYRYGLGLEAKRFDGCGDPQEVFLGHTGDGLGHQTVSFHSADGERQVTLSWSIDDKAGTLVDEDAFDAAVDELLVAGLCGA